MPQRRHIDPFVVRFGQRFHELRKEHGYSLDDLAQGAQLRAKGYLSQFERGMALPTLVVLDRIAQFMGLDLVDLVNFTERGVRNRIIETTRGMTERRLNQVMAQLAAHCGEPTVATVAARRGDGGERANERRPTPQRKP